ncbi:MAG: hypothetical protein CM15mP81_16090 [Alphaproteobacteria bacterium]|nr:MAG: hypothetical protein CM15mP81_16090 [Alphaproteobacteria bacterium]
MIFNKKILMKQFADRQLSLDSEQIEYISKRIERSYSSIIKIVDRVDHLALQNKSYIKKYNKGGNKVPLNYKIKYYLKLIIFHFGFLSLFCLQSNSRQVLQKFHTSILGIILNYSFHQKQ